VNQNVEYVDSNSRVAWPLDLQSMSESEMHLICCSHLQSVNVHQHSSLGDHVNEEAVHADCRGVETMNACTLNCKVPGGSGLQSTKRNNCEQRKLKSGTLTHTHQDPGCNVGPEKPCMDGHKVVYSDSHARNVARSYNHTIHESGVCSNSDADCQSPHRRSLREMLMCQQSRTCAVNVCAQYKLHTHDSDHVSFSSKKKNAKEGLGGANACHVSLTDESLLLWQPAPSVSQSPWQEADKVQVSESASQLREADLADGYTRTPQTLPSPNALEKVRVTTRNGTSSPDVDNVVDLVLGLHYVGENCASFANVMHRWSTSSAANGDKSVHTSTKRCGIDTAGEKHGMIYDADEWM
jgi:hypothetical protein